MEQGRPPSPGGIKNKRANRGRNRGGMANIPGYSRASRARYQPRSIRRQERCHSPLFGLWWSGCGGAASSACNYHPVTSLRDPSASNGASLAACSQISELFSTFLWSAHRRFGRRSRCPMVHACHCLKIKASCGLEPAEARALVAAAVEGGKSSRGHSLLKDPQGVRPGEIVIVACHHA